MRCAVQVDRHLKADILDFEMRDEIGGDLLALQNNPLPADRVDLGRSYGYFHRLSCGYYVSWELIGQQEDIFHLILTGTCRNITIRILGAGRDSPK